MSFKSFLTQVQGLRLVAASAVLFAHVQYEVSNNQRFGHDWATFNLIDGGIGVDIFFLISGFIMYYSSSGDFKSTRNAWDFMIRRLLRVAPMYYVSTFMLVVVAAIGSAHVKGGMPTIEDLIYSFCFIPHRNNAGQVAPILKLGWTLNYEIYFYILFGMAMLFTRRVGMLLLAGWMALSVTMNGLLGESNAAWRVWFDPIVFEFLIGIGIAHCYLAGLRVTSTSGWLMVAVGLSLAILLRQSAGHDFLPRVVLLGLPAAFIVAGIVWKRSASKNDSLSAALIVGGDASFALYLFHPFVIRAVLLIWGKLNAPSYPHILIVIIMVAALFVAILINIWVEKPLNRRLRHVVPRRDVPLQQPAQH